MPRLKNKKTGVEYNVTTQELAQIKANPGLARAFEINEAVVPEEVQALQEQKAAELKTEVPRRKAKGKSR